MFIEHLGALIYRSLWSEMLADRKFCFQSSPRNPRWRHSHWAAPSAICNCPTLHAHFATVWRFWFLTQWDFSRIHPSSAPANIQRMFWT